ncbi:MAG: DUF72 domain-containing protein [Methanocellales archaeon]|nr:DUF72 domain-containing protein [Methanocellales archaeon]
MIHVGCCGFSVGREKYFQSFKLVEVQKTFYKPPLIKTALRWRESAPKDFEFTVKAWQLITHLPKSPTYRRANIEVPSEEKYGFFRPTKEVFNAWERTKEICEALETKIVLFQTPHSFRATKENVANMKEFFSSISGFTFAWEPRGWDDVLVREVCKELGLVHCVDPFVGKPTHGDIIYLRLHGIGGYRYRYKKEDLLTLRRFCEADKGVYCLFNNVYMYENALEFKEMILGI